jgi:hypothetical protein
LALRFDKRVAQDLPNFLKDLVWYEPADNCLKHIFSNTHAKAVRGLDKTFKLPLCAPFRVVFDANDRHEAYGKRGRKMLGNMCENLVFIGFKVKL